MMSTITEINNHVANNRPKTLSVTVLAAYEGKDVTIETGPGVKVGDVLRFVRTAATMGHGLILNT